MENINWISVAVSMLLPMILGVIYYHPKVAGTAWMDSIGMTEEKAKSVNMPMVIGVSLVMSFLLTFFLINFNNGQDQEGVFDTFEHGAWHGAFVGLIVVMPVFVTNGLFEQKGWKNIIINVIYWVLTLALMGGVVDVMHHWPG